MTKHRSTLTLPLASACLSRRPALGAWLFVSVLIAFSVLRTTGLAQPAQQRVDNRRLVWTGSSGAAWDNAVSAAWATSGSFLAYANSGSNSAVWLTSIPETGEAVTAAAGGVTFLAGDAVIFDGYGDGSKRFVTVANNGVTASDIVVNTSAGVDGSGNAFANNYVFTGGAITADAASVAPGSVQLTGTGVGLAADAVRPGGRLIKLGNGALTLSNTTANRFAGGIWLGQGALEIADARALGDNDISVLLGASGAAGSGAINVPNAVVTSGAGNLLVAGAFSGTLRVAPSAAGLDITGDVFLANQALALDIAGDTTISGRIYGTLGTTGANGGTLIKNGAGTLTITGTQNWFYGALKNYNQLNEGRVVIDNPRALGNGATSVNPGAVLEFRGVRGVMRQAFIGGGALEITQGSDVAFDWRNGTLDDYDSMSGNATWQPAMNDIGSITISGRSRFSAFASGTYSTVLGGPNVFVSVTDGSTLVLGREGLSARGSGGTGIPMTYPIYAGRLDFSGGSTLVLNPNAWLLAGTLVFSDTDSAIAFAAAGVSRVQYGAGIAPDSLQYRLADGLKLFMNDIPVPSGYYREYVVVNQGANPLKDIAMTLNAIDAIHDTLSSRLSENFTNPVAPLVPARGRKWVNDVWARGLAGDVRYDAGAINTPGVRGSVNGLVVGLDGILPGRLMLGLHGGMASNNLSTTNATTLASKQRFLGVQAAQRFGKVYFAASVDTGRARSASDRAEAGVSIHGKWDTSYYSASAEAGVTFAPWQKTTLRPYVGLRYAKINISNFYEYGLSPLVIEDFSDTGAQAIYGVALSRQFTLFKRGFAADVSLSRKNTVRAPRASLDTHYFDAPTTLVTLERGDYYSNNTAGAVSLRAALSAHTLAAVSFGYEGGSSYKRSTFAALLGYNW